MTDLDTKIDPRREEGEEKMAFRTVPSFSSESYFKALPILGAYIGCLSLFFSEIDAHKHRYTHMYTHIAEKDP